MKPVSDNVKKFDNLDELSMLLDELNAGRTPECADSETAELLAMAEWAKSADLPVRPPQHILDETVNRAFAGLEAGQPKRTGSWWYSGALGTAAAVLIIGLQMLPSWREQVPAIPAPVVAEKPADTPRTSAVSEQSPTSPQVTPAETAPAVKQNAPSPPPTPLAASQAPAPETPTPVPAKEPARLAEEAPRTSQAKAAYITEEAKPPGPVPSLTPLKLPGKTPDLVVIDRTKGLLRQIYDKGTPQEIIIVQRLQQRDTASTPANLPSNGVSKAMTFTPDTTVVQVTIGDQEITVEGRRSRQELLQLAESLAP